MVPKAECVEDRTVQRWFAGQNDSRLVQKRLREWKHLKRTFNLKHMTNKWMAAEDSERRKVQKKIKRVNQFLQAMEDVKGTGKAWTETPDTGAIRYDPDGRLVAWYELLEERQRLSAERQMFEEKERLHEREMLDRKAYIYEARLALEKEKEAVAKQKKRNMNEKQKLEKHAKALHVKRGYMEYVSVSSSEKSKVKYGSGKYTWTDLAWPRGRRKKTYRGRLGEGGTGPS